MNINLRALAAKCTFTVVEKNKSLAEELPKHLEKVEGKDKGLLQELCYGVLRYLPELENDVRQLMKKPLTGKQRVGHFLLLVGVYQIKYTRIPDHAAVGETVSATTQIKCAHLKGVVNGVLRNFQRNNMPQNSAEAADTEQSNPAKKLPDPILFNHPGWFIKKVQLAYPQQWQQILSANQKKPPMWLRVNSLHHTTEQYIELLDQAQIPYQIVDTRSGAIQLTSAIDVKKLPGFDDGWVSIQDAAAQQAAVLLDCKAGDNVLDCCAAPGGKTCHMLELEPKINAMTALDIEEARLERVQENLTRLKLNAKIVAADAARPDLWWDEILYDRILLDAPCSATGVIRRHPDIKWLRKADDIEKLAKLQQEILGNIWPLLKPGGTLLYATCSVLPEENSQQIACFLNKTADATLVPCQENSDAIGWQILPDEAGMDGFYYAKLVKSQQGNT